MPDTKGKSTCILIVAEVNDSRFVCVFFLLFFRLLFYALHFLPIYLLAPQYYVTLCSGVLCMRISCVSLCIQLMVSSLIVTHVLSFAGVGLNTHNSYDSCTHKRTRNVTWCTLRVSHIFLCLFMTMPLCCFIKKSTSHIYTCFPFAWQQFRVWEHCFFCARWCWLKRGISSLALKN